jgi:hypothetical protein
LKRALLLVPLVLALAAPVLAQQRLRGPGGAEDAGPPRRAYANPTAGIAADLALSHLAQEKGWAGFREAAAPDAVMFAPQMVLADPWLEDRGKAPITLKSQPYQVWSSCDGSLLVTSGVRQAGGADGWYTTVWQRQADGAFKWVFDHGGSLKDPLAAPDMIEARVAECPARRPADPAAAPPLARKRGKAPPVPFDPALRRGRSRDGSLTWEVAAEPTGAHHFSAKMLQGGEMREFRSEKVAAPGS